MSYQGMLPWRWRKREGPARLSHYNARTAEQMDGSVSRSVGRSTSLLGAMRNERNGLSGVAGPQLGEYSFGQLEGSLGDERSPVVSMTTGKLFDVGTRTRAGPARFGEASFTYLNESKRPAFDRVRSLMDEWFAEYPAEH